MKKAPKSNSVSEMREHYDFSNARPNKYAALYATSKIITITLAPDVAQVFPNSEAVNEALRTLMRLHSAQPIANSQ